MIEMGKNKMEFNKRLAELRKSRGMNQLEVAEILGVSVQSYSAYESGREPKYCYLCKLADLFGVTLDFLLCHDPNNNDSVILDLRNQVEQLQKKIESIKNTCK